MKTNIDAESVKKFEAFLNMSKKKKNEIFGIKSKVIEETSHLKLVNEKISVKELTNTFDPTDHFKNGKIKYYLGDNFKKYLLNSTKPFSGISETNFSKYYLKETTDDNDIMSELGISKSAGLMTKEEILWSTAELTSKQPNGESGELLTNGNTTIIGYMLCDDGVVRVVYVHWLSDSRGWDCRCRGLVHWRADGEVLSRN